MWMFWLVCGPTYAVALEILSQILEYFALQKSQLLAEVVWQNIIFPLFTFWSLKSSWLHSKAQPCNLLEA